MKHKLDHLLQQARTATHGIRSAQDEPLPPGISTRIASRWAASDDRALHMILLERITACCLVPALAAWAILTWTTPTPSEPNVMELLLTAKLVVDSPPPF